MSDPYRMLSPVRHDHGMYRVPSPSRRIVQSLSRDRRGVALVELALTLPILMLLLFGIVSGGTWLALAHAMQQGANESARAALAGLTTGERVKLAGDTARSVLKRSYGIPAADIAVTVTDDGRTLMVDVTYDGSGNPLLSMPFAPVATTRIGRRSSVLLTGL